MLCLEDNYNFMEKYTTEYKIGNTTYVVTTKFNLTAAETVLEVVQRLVMRELEIVS